MRIAPVIFFALLFGRLLTAQDAVQSPPDSTISKQKTALSLPDYPVRLTLLDSLGRHRVFGLVTSLTTDSVVIRSLEEDSLVAVPRSAVVRIQRQRPHDSIQKAALVGCLSLGGILGLAGSQAHDPDSPGLEKALAVYGFAFGRVIGGLGGAGVGLLESRMSWVEVQL